MRWEGGADGDAPSCKGCEPREAARCGHSASSLMPPCAPPHRPSSTHLQLGRGAGRGQRGAHRGHALVAQAGVVQDEGLA